MSVFSKTLIFLTLIFFSTTCHVFGQSDLVKLLDLVDQTKPSPLSEIKQLRARNSQSGHLAPLFDFGFGLSAIHNGRPQEAIEVLEPFVDQRPQVYQARLLLIRAYIDCEQFDQVVLHAEKLLANYPPEQNSAEKVAKTLGTLVGYLSFARDDCAEEWKQRLENAAEAKIPQSLVERYRESMTLVKSRVASIQEEINSALAKAGLESDAKVASNLSEAEDLREKAKEEATELQNREKERAQKIGEMKSIAQKIESDYWVRTAKHAQLDREIGMHSSEQKSLERKEERRDKDGNTTTTTEIQDPRRYSELGSLIAGKRSQKIQLQAQMAVLMNNFQQLRNQAAGLLSQQQMDQLFSGNKMNQLGKEANIKERKAKRESDRKGKDVPAARVLNAKLKKYATYEPLDMASYTEFLQHTAKRFLTK